MKKFIFIRSLGSLIFNMYYIQKVKTLIIYLGGFSE